MNRIDLPSAYRNQCVTVYQGDCLDVLPTLADFSVDAIVTDPPAGIAFMGQTWDTPGAWRAPVSRHGFTDGAERLPAPAIGSSRNPVCRRCHRHRRGATAAAICRCHQPDFDDASARLKDRRAFVSFLAAVMAQCLRVLKPGGHAIVWAIPRTSHWTATALEDAGFDVRDVITHHYGSGFPKSLNLKGDWQGWGTALKPASEHWILARRPLSEANTALNVQRWRTGALNIDAGRRPMNDRLTAGRWPANLLLSHSLDCNHACAPDCPVARLDEQSGYSRTRRIRIPSDCGGNTWGGSFQIHRGPRGYDDSGGASRFFYVSKPSARERDAGLDDLPMRLADPYGHHRGRRSRDKRRFDGRRPRIARNHHPTVKSVLLMRYLCQLITPPSGVILDCFAGSGSTLIAAASLGFRAIGIEREADYVEIIRHRLDHAEKHATIQVVSR